MQGFGLGYVDGVGVACHLDVCGCVGFVLVPGHEDAVLKFLLEGGELVHQLLREEGHAVGEKSYDGCAIFLELPMVWFNRR